MKACDYGGFRLSERLWFRDGEHYSCYRWSKLTLQVGGWSVWSEEENLIELDLIASNSNCGFGYRTVYIPSALLSRHQKAKEENVSLNAHHLKVY